jgi:hypothetical protein
MIKKYKVRKKHPKPIMNANRLVILQPNTVVYLKYEGQMRDLVKAGVLVEITEFKKQPKKKEPVKQHRPNKKFQKSEVKAVEAKALEDKSEQE